MAAFYFSSLGNRSTNVERESAKLLWGSIMEHLVATWDTNFIQQIDLLQTKWFMSKLEEVSCSAAALTVLKTELRTLLIEIPDLLYSVFKEIFEEAAPSRIQTQYIADVKVKIRYDATKTVPSLSICLWYVFDKSVDQILWKLSTATKRDVHDKLDDKLDDKLVTMSYNHTAYMSNITKPTKAVLIGYKLTPVPSYLK